MTPISFLEAVLSIHNLSRARLIHRISIRAAVIVQAVAVRFKVRTSRPTLKSARGPVLVENLKVEPLDRMQDICYNMTCIPYITAYIFSILTLLGGKLDVKRTNRVKLARVEHDLTQAQLARRVGVTRQTIGLIERGGYNPTLRLCLAIARAVDKTLDQLFWIEEDSHDKG
jgi:putative transcriptional regulator